MKTQGKFFDDRYSEIDLNAVSDLKIIDYQFIMKHKILSVGSGTCSDIWFLTKDNRIWALDSSKEAVEIAKKHNIKAEVYDVQKNLPFADNMFDIVILKDILEHLVDPLAVLNEAKRVLKNNGYIVISIPNHFSLWFRLRIIFGKNIIWKTIGGFDHTKYFDEWDYMHIRFFTWKGIQKMLGKAKLKLDKTFWDFDTLAHYNDPEMYLPQMEKRAANGDYIAIRFLRIFKIYQIFSLIFPKRIRAKIVSINPDLMCAGFYFHARKI